MWMDVIIAIKSGDPYAIIVLTFLFFSLMVFFERIIMLHFSYNINFKKFMLNLKKMVLSKDYDRASQLCKATSMNSVPWVAFKAIEALEKDPSTVRGAIEEETMDLIPRIEARINILPVFATAVVLVGVLGSIDEIWTTLNTIQILDTPKKQATAALGVSGSLHRTALSICVCMAIILIHHMAKSMALRLLDKVYQSSVVLINLLAPQGIAFGYAAPMPVSEQVIAAESNDLISTLATSETTNAKSPAPSMEDIKDEEEII